MGYCTATDIMEYGNFSSTDTPGILAHLCSRAQQIIDTYCGRSFEFTTDDDANEERYYTYDYDCDENTLWLDKDLLAVGSDGIKAGETTIASSDYWLLPPNDPPYYAIRLKEQSPRDWTDETSDGDIENAIEVHGSWGMYSSSAPADIKHASIRLAYWMYKQRETNADLDRPLLTGDGVTIMPTRLPRDVSEILESYRRKVFA